MVGRYGVLRNSLCPQHKHDVERDCFAQISNGRVVCSLTAFTRATASLPSSVAMKLSPM